MRRTALAAVLAALVVSLVAWSGSRRPPRPTAVILVIVDTLRADRFAAWGADRVVTPRLDRWLESAVVFEQARAPSPWTLPSFASMYTGCDPARHGSRVVDPRAEASSFVGADARLPRLAEIVSAAGWNTAGFVTNRFLSPAFGLARGFRRYDQTWRFSRDPPRANAGVDSALTWIDRVGDAPFLLVLHVFDPHLPYDPPPETLGRFSGGYGGDVRLPIDKVGRIRSGKIPLGEADRAFIRDVYDEEIAFTDEQLGRFLDGLREREIFERALVVLTSDHGEELWDHGGFEHGHTLYDELLHVPLAAWAPGVEARRVAGAVTLTDLMPTVLDAAGLPVPEGLDGVSLWPVVADRRSPPERVLVAESPLYVTARRAIIAWPWKLVVRDEEGEHELYELETDPGEERDVAAERSDVVQRLLEAAAGRDSSASLPNGPTVELDEETLESLRARLRRLARGAIRGRPCEGESGDERASRSAPPSGSRSGSPSPPRADTGAPPIRERAAGSRSGRATLPLPKSRPSIPPDWRPCEPSPTPPPVRSRDGEPMGVTRFDRERTCPGNRLATVHRGCRADLIDEEGNLLRSWSVEGSLQWERALRLKDGGLLVVGADIHQWPEGSGSVPGQIADETRYVMRFDREGNVLWKRFLTAHHDLEIRPDGRIAVLTFERRLAPEIDDEVRTRDDRLTLLDPDDGSELESIGMLSMVLASPEVFPLSEVKAVEFGGERWIDVFHSNSIEWMDREPLFGTHPLYSPEHALVSFRNQDRVAIFDTRRRDVAWAWGRGEVRGPHDAQLLPGGTILLFDNGLGRKWSRAIEVDPRTDEIVWEWRSDPPEDFYSASRGAAQRLPNGNTLLTESSRGRAIELAPDGEIVWEWYCPHLARNGDRLTIVRMQWVGDVD